MNAPQYSFDIWNLTWIALLGFMLTIVLVKIGNLIPAIALYAAVNFISAVGYHLN